MPTPVPAAKPEKYLREVSVLVVDDDRRIAKLIRSVLAGLGFEDIVVAHSGEEALALLSKREMDMIICDWMMDGMTGVEMVEHLRRDIANPNQLVPVIMLSGNSEKPQIEAARDSGVTEYVMKPFTAKSLCSRITAVIEQPRSFIISDGFSGHNRRRKSRQYGGNERRARR